ncbi:MAG: sulfotransferase [Rhodanobacter sp.]|jgi:hypothetical protein|nr:sulfotransferase [Rhodanobacter sp.]
MRLQFPFIQLPLRYDAAVLAAEVAAIDESQWRAHPQGFSGNSALPLVAVDGDPDNDGLIGPMRPTPLLERFAYLKQVLASLGAVLGRTRLMRLSGQAEVAAHVDQAYYWAERMRVHVPIVTQPGVRFRCDDIEMHMAAGECWIFDTWRWHHVLNQGDESRIHLVADTVGGEGFWEHMLRSRPHHMHMPGWQPTLVAPQTPAATDLQFESVNSPPVMSPWELHSHLSFLFSQLQPQQPAAAQAQQAAMRFMRLWQALWAQYGDTPAGRPEFRKLLNAFIDEMRGLRGELLLTNDLDFHKALMIMVLGSALIDEVSPVIFGEPRTAPTKTIGRDAEFDRPVFIVSPPRSGSTFLFETLTQAKDVYTIGDESHALIEGIGALQPRARGFASNRLGVDAAGSDVIKELRARFRAELRDRDGAPPARWPLRMLEKTPKNALRIPFLAKVFPEAQFIYLHRDVRQVLASMIEAWNSGRFRTYPNLPGWNGLPWSLTLTPGWRELDGKPLHEIVAAQWRTLTEILLDDLSALPRDRVHIARYAALTADTAGEIARLCAAVGFAWDRPLEADLPLSRYTVSQPDPQKWRKYAGEIESVLPGLSQTIARSDAFAAG